MKKTEVLLKKKNIMIMVMFFLLVLWNSCSKSDTTPNSTPTGNTSGVSNTVTIQGFAFNPASLTVPVNTTVTWVNKDGTAHTVSSDNGLFESGGMASNQNYSFKFTTAGTYNYHCSLHPEMKAKIIVQ